MKKTLKKLLCVLMAVLMVFALAACNDKKNEEDAAAEAEKVFEDFMEAHYDFDYEKAAEYLSDDEEYLEKFEDEYNDMLDTFPKEYHDEAEKMFKKGIVAFSEYEIISTEADGEAYVVTFERTNVEENDSKSLYQEYINDHAQEVNSAYSSGDYSTMIEIMGDAYDYAAENADTETKEREVVVIKDGDKWVIDVEEGDFDELLD